MSLLDSAMAFVEGIKSVIDVSETAQSTISDTVSDGIEHAFMRIQKPMERSLLRVALIAASLFLIIWGVALFIDSLSQYHGLGFVLMKRAVLQRLVDRGNTVIVIEHNLDVIKSADWVIDLGPEGGERGGKVVAEGTPEEIVRKKASFTGEYLRKVLK